MNAAAIIRRAEHQSVVNIHLFAGALIRQAAGSCG
jgi:hypothetical protein